MNTDKCERNVQSSSLNILIIFIFFLEKVREKEEKREKESVFSNHKSLRLLLRGKYGKWKEKWRKREVYQCFSYLYLPSHYKHRFFCTSEKLSTLDSSTPPAEQYISRLGDTYRIYLQNLNHLWLKVKS